MCNLRIYINYLFFKKIIKNYKVIKKINFFNKKFLKIILLLHVYINE